MKYAIPVLLMLGIPWAAGAQLPAALRLTELDLSKVAMYPGVPNPGPIPAGHPQTLGAGRAAGSFRTDGPAVLVVNLKAAATKFQATLAADDEAAQTGATVSFCIFLDGKRRFQTAALHGGEAPIDVSLDVSGVQEMQIYILAPINQVARADWIDPRLTLSASAAAKPATADAPPIALGIDVTATVAAAVKADALTLMSSNVTFGNDPAPAVPKTVVIEYTVAGAKHIAKIPEETMIQLPLAQDGKGALVVTKATYGVLTGK